MQLCKEFVTDVKIPTEFEVVLFGVGSSLNVLIICIYARHLGEFVVVGHLYDQSEIGHTHLNLIAVNRRAEICHVLGFVAENAHWMRLSCGFLLKTMLL